MTVLSIPVEPRRQVSVSPFHRSVQRIVLTWLTTAEGGAERSTLELAHGLRRLLGVDVVVLWWSYQERDSTAPAARFGVRMRRVTGMESYFRALVAEVSRDPAGTVLIGTHRTALIDVPVARTQGASVVTVLRGMLVAGHRLRTADPVSGRLASFAPEELDWGVLADTDRWVGVSHAATASVREHAPVPVRARTIHNGVPVLPRPPVFNPSPVRRLSVVSRIEPWKRVDRVIAAYAALPPDVACRMRLNIFGEGSSLPALRQLAAILQPAGEVVFHGHVPDRWTEETDILVSASNIEGFGRTVVEAGTAGIPQIVPDRGGSAELVVPGATGLTYPGDDTRALSAALAEAAFWTNQELEAMGRRAHVHARSFSHARYVTAYMNLALDLRLRGSARAAALSPV